MHKSFTLVILGALLFILPVNGGVSEIKAQEETVDSIKEESNQLFEELKNKYTELSEQYGDIKIVDGDKLYQTYLEEIQKSKEDLRIDEKLDEIQNIDLSIDNREMREEFEKAKIEAGEKLSEAKLNSDAIIRKFDKIKEEQTTKQNELEQERIEVAQTRYNNIVKGYYEILNKTPASPAIAKPEGIGQYNAADLKYLSLSMGINFDKAIATGKMGLLQNLAMHLANEGSKVLGTSQGADLYSW